MAVEGWQVADDRWQSRSGPIRAERWRHEAKRWEHPKMYPLEQYPCPPNLPARPLAFGLVVLIMLCHLYHTAPLLQNFHDLSGKMNNMSLDHGRGAMLNRPPGPGGSYPPQVPSKQFPQPTRWGTYTVPILQPTHSPIYPPTNIALTHNIDHKIIRYLWF